MNTSLEDVASHVDTGDLNWLRARHRAGELDWLKSRLGTDEFDQLKTRLDNGDLPWLRDRLRAAGIVSTGKRGGVVTAGAEPRTKKPWWLWLFPLLVLAGLFALLLSRCGSDSTTVSSSSQSSATVNTKVSVNNVTAATSGNIADLTKGANYSILNGLLAKSGLGDSLKGSGPFTLFAPTDAAFANVDKATLAALEANPETLKKVLSYHVISGSLKAADLKAGKLKTFEGSELTIAVDGANIKADSANVTSADAAATNGQLHAIDSVVIPSDVDLTRLIAATPPTTATAPATTAPLPTTATPAAPAKFSVFYDSGLDSPNAATDAVVGQAIAALKSRPAGTKVNIVGYADPQGDQASNLALSRSRADKVKARLAADAPTATYTVDAKGDAQSDPNNLAQSRRVEIAIS